MNNFLFKIKTNMWIILNNKPIQTSEIVNISKILECTIEKLVPSAQRYVNPDDYPYYFFVVNKDIRSKRYKTFEEAEESRNSLLLTINTTEASLPKINI